MPSSEDSSFQPKRPSTLQRNSSTSSAVTLLQSPTTPVSQHRPHKPQKHVVGGHGRLVQRNSSFGKNLNKLNKQTTSQGTEPSAKIHRRAHSGSSTPTESQRPHVKRNASTVGIVRHTTQAPIRKNHSSGHLPRNSSSKNMLKSSKSEIAPKRSGMKPPRSRPSSRDSDGPTVHFDLGNEEGEQDEEWTEESASQSPNTTRSNTRANSVILDPHAGPGPVIDHERGLETPTPPNAAQQSPAQSLSRRSTDPHHINGGSSYTSSRPPDADMITSRLLRRTASNHPQPQLSSVSASVAGDTHDNRTLSHSQGSTLAETPGRDLVSRFMDGDGSQGTPRDSNFLPPRNSPKEQSNDAADNGVPRRNKSTPNMTGSSTTSSRANSRRSGANTPTSELNPSRTQQKLWLQRASSNIEPQKLIPVTLPRAGAPQYLGQSVNYPPGDGRMDARVQRQFDQMSLEYRVVRRYRSPLADSLNRLDKLPSSVKKAPTPRSARSRLSQTTSDMRTAGFEGDDEGRGSFESDPGLGRRTPRNEAEELCRRMWDSAEVPGEE